MMKEYPFAQDYANFSEDLLTDDILEKLYQPQVAAQEETEEATSYALVRARRGYFSENRYHAPQDLSREEYLQSLYEEGFAFEWNGYSSYSGMQLVHLERSDTLNFYHPDFLQTLSCFLHYYGKGELLVLNGFRSPHALGANPHALRIAMDLETKNTVHAYRIMNAAYMAGIPTIIPGGEFAKGEGFIHLDLAPAAMHNYGAGTYEGPWS